MATRLPVDHTSQADLDFLDMLTSNSSSLGSLGLSQKSNCGHDHPPGHPHNQPGSFLGFGAQPVAKSKPVPRRDEHMDSLLLSAVLSGSGPVTRHHFGHGGECDARITMVGT